MSFNTIKEQPNIDDCKSIIHSILNSGYGVSFVVDKTNFEILYLNDRAKSVMGDCAGELCHKVLCMSDSSCVNCPMSGLSNSSVMRRRFEELFDQYVTWQYSDIKWFDGRDAVLTTLVESEQQNDSAVNGMRSQITSVSETSKRDSLTGIPSYAMFYSDIEIRLKENSDKEYAVVVFDIDKFKNINDLYGMTKGDEALKLIAQVLKDTFGFEENFARMHSDMFAFCMEYTRKGEIIKTIERMRKDISSYSLEFDINTTYGIYLVNDRSVPVNLMCDRAMIASRTVKGNVLKFCAFYDEQYREDMLKTSEIERDMHQALEQRDFTMFLQPKFRLSDESLCGAEVLCRWIHPEKGIIPPMDFIPLFEKNGFILKLDEYMWEEACKALRMWIDQGRNPVPLSVNISRYHIQHNDLEGVLLGLINKYDISPNLLVLEITESLFLDKPEELNRVLVKLQSLGFKLEVDDFGSGFSSLNMIRNITVDTIKIDKDFLDNEIASSKGKIVVNHTIDMAKDLNLQVVAEGVETREHVEFLKNSRCDVAQGFFFARPMPLSEFNKYSF